MQELEAEDAAHLFKMHCINKYGGINKYAKHHGVSASYVRRMADCDVQLNELALQELGLEKHKLVLFYYTRKE